jgi:hypothetical protein
MISYTRTLLVIAGLAVLAVSSQATISFSNLNGLVSDNDLALNDAANQMNATAVNLIDFPVGAGTVSATGSFDVTTSTSMIALDVNEVFGVAYNGTLSLTVDLYNGTTVASGVEATLYDQSAVAGVLAARLYPTFQNNNISFTGTKLITISASFTGTSGSSLGYLGGFAVDAYDAVPEPAAYATLGIGIIGLLARRRRSGK